MTSKSKVGEKKLFVISVFLPDKKTAEKVMRDIAFDYNTSVQLLKVN